jgi:4-aminobutyrate aminotransferase-like enzyme
VLDYLEQRNLVHRAGEVGHTLHAALTDRLSELDCIGDVRGLGLFLGVELVADRATKAPFPSAWDVSHRVVAAAQRRGVLLLAGVPGLLDGVGGDHFEVLPPYVIEDEHIEQIVATIYAAIAEVRAELAA